jgi:hypothetical protein
MGTVLPMLPVSAGATAAKVLVCLLYYAIVKLPPWGARKKRKTEKPREEKVVGARE